MAVLYNADETLCLKYIVPFKYSGDFESVCALVDSQQDQFQKTISKKKSDNSKEKETVNITKKAWIRFSDHGNLDVANSDNGTINNKYYHPVSESDLYDYIRTEFYLGDYGEPISPKKEGGQWIYWASTKLKDKERKGHLSNNLAYFPDGLTKISKKRLSEKEEKSKKQADEQAEEQVEKQVTNEFADKSLSIDLVDDENITKWGFDISSLGLYLFRNGFGFLWYEIKLDTDANADSISAPDLEIFQNRIKELNFKNGEVWFWEKIDKIPIVGIDLGKESSEKADHEYYKPFCMGTWINEKLCFLSPEYIAKRNYSSPEKYIKNHYKGILSKVDSSQPIQNDQASAGGDTYVPDKAILFTYAAFNTVWGDDTADERAKLAYHITNGYTDSYKLCDETSEQLFKPFGNVIWYATQEGASYLAWPDETNEEVFKSNIRSKVKTDYFTLFIKVLYQSYSLMLYGQRINNEISAKSSDKKSKKLDAISEEVNRFLTKSLATSVSHIHHQSTFYNYLKKQLRLKEDVESISLGVNALNKLERIKDDEKEAKRDKRTSAILGFFAIITIPSALVDTFGFLWNLDKDFGNLTLYYQQWDTNINKVIAILSILMILITLKAIWDAFTD